MSPAGSAVGSHVLPHGSGRQFHGQRLFDRLYFRPFFPHLPEGAMATILVIDDEQGIRNLLDTLPLVHPGCRIVFSLVGSVLIRV
jgi:hypothetical protein